MIYIYSKLVSKLIICIKTLILYFDSKRQADEQKPPTLHKF